MISRSMEWSSATTIHLLLPGTFRQIGDFNSLSAVARCGELGPCRQTMVPQVGAGTVLPNGDKLSSGCPLRHIQEVMFPASLTGGCLRTSSDAGKRLVPS